MLSINASEENEMDKWVTPTRLYLDENGHVVGESYTGRKTLLAPEGRALDDATCQRYQLGPHAPAPPPKPAAESKGKAKPHHDDDDDED